MDTHQIAGRDTNIATDTHRVAPRGTTTATELHGEATWAKDTHGVELKATELLRYGLLRQGSEKIDADMIRNGFESKSRAGARKHRVLLRKGEPEQSITKQCDGADERSPATALRGEAWQWWRWHSSAEFR